MTNIAISPMTQSETYPITSNHNNQSHSFQSVTISSTPSQSVILMPVFYQNTTILSLSQTTCTHTFLPQSFKTLSQYNQLHAVSHPDVLHWAIHINVGMVWSVTVSTVVISGSSSQVIPRLVFGNNRSPVCRHCQNNQREFQFLYLEKVKRTGSRKQKLSLQFQCE